MVPIERVRTRTADSCPQPLCITVTFGTGRPCPLSHHRKARPVARESACAACALLREDVGTAQALPQGFEDIARALGPGIAHAPLGGGLPKLWGSTLLTETAGQGAQTRGGCELRRASALVAHADLRALLLGMPPALDQLQRRAEGAISALLTGFTSVPVRKNKAVHAPMARFIYKSMYRGVWRTVSRPIRIIPTTSIRTSLAYWLQCTCWCQSRV